MKQQQPNNYLFLDNPQLTMTDIGLVTCLISRCRNFADIKLARIRSLREKRKLALQDFWPILWKIEFWSVSLFLAQDIIYYCIQRGRKRTRRTTGEVQKHLRSDWLSIATHYVLGQSGRKEKKNTRDLLVRGFPRFAPSARTFALRYDWFIWSSTRIVIGQYHHSVSMVLNWLNMKLD